MKKIILLMIGFIIAFITPAQNVGIGTTTPTEKLDVNGNINLSGNLKVNNVAGTSGQALMTNGSGLTHWGNVGTEYKNFATFTNTGAGTWTVPAGVTKILCEAWGGGGGGSADAGGGGGGYVTGVFTVTPGSVINFNIGAGGNGGAANTSTSGTRTTISSGTLTLYANPGSRGALITYIIEGAGGTFRATGATNQFTGINGEDGAISTANFESDGSTRYIFYNGGRGGDAGNSINTGGSGRYNMRRMLTSWNRYSIAGHGKQPGGGGGGGTPVIVEGDGNGLGGNGGDGMVTIHY